MVNFKTNSGSDIDLARPWSIKQKPSVQIISEPTTLVFSINTVVGSIEKSLTFYPDTYLIHVDINTKNVSSEMFAGQYFFSWKGGLPLTEKNKTDDLMYTNAFLSG